MRRILPLFIVLLVLPLIGAGCLGGGDGQVTLTPVTLTYWRVQDDATSMQPIIDAYKKLHPNVEIEYVKVRAEDYEDRLREAFAEDRGPDIFSIPNVWFGGWQGKILPLPEAITIPTQIVNERQQIVTVNKTTETPGEKEVVRDYIEVAAEAMLHMTEPAQFGEQPRNAVWGIPLSADTLALYYNIDLLAKADIPAPPTTWSGFQEQVRKLTVLDDQGEVKQSGAAIGGGENILNILELMSAIMMQNGAKMIARGNPAFQLHSAESSGRPVPPGEEALIYYQSFATKGSSNYTWNEDMPSSIDAFIAGKTAFFFGFPGDAKTIAERAPKLNFAVSSLPQIDPSKRRNIAKFPLEVVSKKTRHPDYAWDFLLFTSMEEQVLDYLTATGRPTALRSLIDDQLTNAAIEPYANQLLTAETWFYGQDYAEAVEVFVYMALARPTFEDPSFSPILLQGSRDLRGALY